MAWAASEAQASCEMCIRDSYKVNPPLRSADHVESCLAGVIDGTLDVICLSLIHI